MRTKNNSKKNTKEQHSNQISFTNIKWDEKYGFSPRLVDLHSKINLYYYYQSLHEHNRRTVERTHKNTD